MLSNPCDVLDRWDKMKDSEKTAVYMKFFEMPGGDMVLCDLMDKCHEFKPTSDAFEAGKQSVLIYIKNRLLGICEPDPAPPEEHQP